MLLKIQRNFNNKKYEQENDLLIKVDKAEKDIIAIMVEDLKNYLRSINNNFGQEEFFLLMHLDLPIIIYVLHSFFAW